MVKRALSKPTGPTFHREIKLLSEGKRLVCGVDEVGRGPLAGPVVAAAVILDPSDIPAGLNDSKKLTPAKRLALYDAISKSSIAWSVASICAPGIDAINIRAASLEAMRRSVAALCVHPDHALIDGNVIPDDLDCTADYLIGGDSFSYSIAAASIMAKVMRDTMMEQADAVWPVYGFGRHKGYGTAYHRAAITEHGPCPLHRMSFAPMRLQAERSLKRIN